MSVFDEARARVVLGVACRAAGLPGAEGARLLALGENAVFDLGRPAVVAKVGRAAELAGRAGRELAVACWLEAVGLPAVRPYLPEVVRAVGRPVTFWHRLPEAARPARAADLAPLLLALHRLPAPPFPLGPRGLLDPVDRWLAAAEGAADPADLAFLRRRRDGFAAAVGELEPQLPPGVIHGDALPRNVLVGPEGPVLLDLENVSSDLREYDLVVPALAHDRYGEPAEEYRAFTAAYGWDVREWAGFAVLRGVRETASACWVAQHVPGNPAAAAEFRRRVASLREGDATARWHAF